MVYIRPYSQGTLPTRQVCVCRVCALLRVWPPTAVRGDTLRTRDGSSHSRNMWPDGRHPTSRSLWAAVRGSKNPAVREKSLSVARSGDTVLLLPSPQLTVVRIE